MFERKFSGEATARRSTAMQVCATSSRGISCSHLVSVGMFLITMETPEGRDALRGLSLCRYQWGQRERACMGLMDSLARRAIIAAPASIIVRVPAIISRFPVPVTHLIQAENGKSAKMHRWEASSALRPLDAALLMQPPGPSPPILLPTSLAPVLVELCVSSVRTVLPFAAKL